MPFFTSAIYKSKVVVVLLLFTTFTSKNLVDGTNYMNNS